MRFYSRVMLVVFIIACSILLLVIVVMQLQVYKTLSLSHRQQVPSDLTDEHFGKVDTRDNYSAVQSQKARKQLLPFGFEELHGWGTDNYYDDRVNILFWTKYQGRSCRFHLENNQILKYPNSNCTCYFYYDNHILDTADAVLFDFRCPTFLRGKKLNLPNHHIPDQYWILYNHEYLRPNDKAEMLLQDGIYNLSATYSRRSDIYLPYGKCGPRFESSDITLPKKTGLITWHRSICSRTSLRDEFVKELSKYVNVTVVGSCKKGVNSPHRIKWGNAAKLDTENQLNRYKFYLALENTYCQDYITEKLYKVNSHKTRAKCWLILF